MEAVQQNERSISAQLAAQERDIAARIRRVRDEETAVHRVHEQERLDLLVQVETMEKDRHALTALFEGKLHDKDKDITDVLARARNAENEVASTTTKIQNIQASLIEKEGELSSYKKKLDDAKSTNTDLQKLLSDAILREQTIQRERDRLASKAASLEAEVNVITQHAGERMSEEHRKLLDQGASQIRKIEKLRNRYTKAKNAYLALKQHSERVVGEQHHQIRMLTTKLERLGMERDNISIGMKQKLSEASTQPHLGGAHKTVQEENRVPVPPEASRFPWRHLVEEEHRTKSELASLSSHLSTLSQYQQTGIDNIASLSSVNT